MIKDRYLQAHENYFKEQYPNAYRNGHYTAPKMPIVAKANGLTTFIINYLTWNGFRATRINVSGRLIDGVEKTASGAVLTTKKWMRSTTRKGTADISATINGRSVMIEIKVGKDKPSEHQLLEQARERKAGGIYEFCSSPEEFFKIYDKVVNL
jgi:hypothetical protein